MSDTYAERKQAAQPSSADNLTSFHGRSNLFMRQLNIATLIAFDLSRLARP